MSAIATLRASTMVQRLLHAGAWAHAGTRVGLGTALLTAPKQVAVPWLGESVNTPGGRAALANFAIRDAVIGAGTLGALRRGDQVRHWFALGVLVEAVDITSAFYAQRHDPTATDSGRLNYAGMLGLVGGLTLAVLLDEKD